MDQKESCALANKLNLKKSDNTQENTYTRLGKKESTIDYIMTSKETKLNKAVNITSSQKIQQGANIQRAFKFDHLLISTDIRTKFNHKKLRKQNDQKY